ncbi:EamA family transporter RarD, partial [Xanthomonas citri pv. citri]|nr:EamA family transporter RarD [Xanthomonas citri pv. citri]
LIATNWTTYVVAVNNGRTLDASLGYYLNPLLNMAAGAWLFRERIDRFGAAAIGLAAVGVVLQALALGHAPWVSLLLAFSFAAYG